ncbi:ABC transporter permease [Gluconobacter potus]|uniref:ABC transporter permease n=1 Tax=Gluconobacter potus TaxID=2724927 RepID=A0A149QVS9_9PROT|nr:ABC transporter permease [Gluconobacter potus]KXV01428.1 ABC transporter permease [Gluconobacter potus]
MKRFVPLGPESVLSIGVLAVFGLAILFPSALTHSDPTTGVAKDHLLAPDWAHWFGTDQLGRDVLTRIIYGARETLPAALLATLTGVVLGAFIGGLAALSAPVVDGALSGVIDVLLSIPELLLALTVVILTGFGPLHAALAVGISQTASFARIIRNLVRSLRAMPYIEAARLSGTGFGGMIWWHILPNAFRPVLGLTVLRYSMAILSLATLGFLGYGAPPPTPEWGLMIAEGRDYLATAWWMTTFPGLALLTVAFATNRLSHAMTRPREDQP